jgi:hypothetical protein
MVEIIETLFQFLKDGRVFLDQFPHRADYLFRAAKTALRLGLRDVAAGFEEADARADALSGNCGTLRHLLDCRGFINRIDIVLAMDMLMWL